MITSRLQECLKEEYGISDAGITRFLNSADQKIFSKGDIIHSEGGIARSLYFVEEGWIRTFLKRDGNEINVNFNFEGTFAGDIKSLKTGCASGLNISAGETCTLTFFKRDDLLQLPSESDEFERFSRQILAQIYLENQDQLEFNKIPSPLARYDYLMQNKPYMIRRLPVTHLSSYIGVARETLSRIRNNYRRGIL